MKYKESYSDECDRLAEAEISQLNISWGRWYFDDGMISTWVCLPGASKVKSPYLYQFSIEKCLSPEQQVEMLKSIAENKWVGAKGLLDLAKVFNSITKRQKGSEKFNDN